MPFMAKFHSTISRDEPAAKLFERVLIVSQIIIFKVDNAITLLVAQLDLFENILQ